MRTIIVALANSFWSNRWCNSFKTVLSSFSQVSAKRKEFAHHGSKFFPFRVDPLSRRWNRKSQKFFLETLQVCLVSLNIFYLYNGHVCWSIPTLATPSGLFCLNSLDQSISSLRVSGQFWIVPCFIEMPVVNANSVDPDQTPRSDLDLHCLSMSHLWDARHKWVKVSKMSEFVCS